MFARPEERAFSGQPLQLTEQGIWLPTPLDVVGSALAALESRGFWSGLGPTPTLLDAGMGDGRLVASFCKLGSHVRACGVESHPSLFALALENLRALPESNWSVCRGDFLDATSFEALGVPLGEIYAVFNYPDGNEEALAQYWSKHGRPGSFLVFVTPDQGMRLEGLTLHSQLSIERGFHLYLYQLDERRR